MTEREAFEQWAVTEDFSVARDQWDRYASIATQHALAGWQASRQQALEEAAKVPRAYAEQLDRAGWGNRFPDELCAIFNASTNMADQIRSLTTTGDKA